MASWRSLGVAWGDAEAIQRLQEIFEDAIGIKCKGLEPNTRQKIQPTRSRMR